MPVLSLQAQLHIRADCEVHRCLALDLEVQVPWHISNRFTRHCTLRGAGGLYARGLLTNLTLQSSACPTSPLDTCFSFPTPHSRLSHLAIPAASSAALSWERLQIVQGFPRSFYTASPATLTAQHWLPRLQFLVPTLKFWICIHRGVSLFPWKYMKWQITRAKCMIWVWWRHLSSSSWEAAPLARLLRLLSSSKSSLRRLTVSALFQHSVLLIPTS